MLVRDRVPDCAQALFLRETDMQNLTVMDDRIESQAVVNELDAHELGHHRNTVQDIFANLPRDLFSVDAKLAGKIEARADREAVSITVSPERIIEAYAEGCREPWGFAEALEITERAFVDGVEQQQHRFETRAFYYLGYCLTFEPLKIASVS